MPNYIEITDTKKTKDICVDICMATYNGEKYIEQQILSLISQTHKNWRLLISDDGSNDNTISIVQKYIKIDNRINLIETSDKNIGPGKKFLSILNCSTSDYIMFCDQDDIWLETKIEDLLDFSLRNFNNKIPCLSFCDGYLFIQKDMRIINKRISMKKSTSIKDFIFNNGGYQGCSILFNKELRDIIKGKDFSWVYMHDHVISLLAHTFGKVFYLDKKLMLYRQHEKNVTGNTDTKLISSIKSIITKKIPLTVEKHFNEKKYIFNNFSQMMDKLSFEVYEKYIKINECSKIKRTVLLAKEGFSLSGSRLFLIAKSIIKK